MLLKNGILLASPLEVAKSLAALVATGDFWQRVANSFVRIVAGFFSACIAGAALAALSCRFSAVKTLISPLARVIKATPVVSFIILALIWINSENLSTFISFLMVVPIIYINTLSGIEAADKKLLEVSKVFDMRGINKVRYIYLPAAAPYFISGASVGLGLCWKSGIAAEVIGLPSGTIGEKLYETKLYLDTADLFAYTAVIIIISAMFEFVFLKLVGRLSKKMQSEAE